MGRPKRQMHLLRPESEASRVSRNLRSRERRSILGWLTGSSGNLLDPRSRPAQRANERRGPERHINGVLIIATVVLLAAFAPAAYYWHEFQVGRQGEVLLEAADRAQAGSDWYWAEKYLRQYLAFHPDDVEALGRLAYVIDKSAGGVAFYRIRAINAYAYALDKDPERDDFRQALAELQLITNPQAALTTAESILAKDPTSLAALKVRAEALDQLSNVFMTNPVPIRQVIKAHEDVLKADPADHKTAVRLAMLLRTHADDLVRGDPNALAYMQRRADRIIDELKKQPDLSAEAHLVRYRYRMTYGSTAKKPERVGELDEDLEEAIAREPNNLEVRMAMAEDAAGMPLQTPLVGARSVLPVDPVNLKAAEAHLTAAVAFAGFDPRPYLALAQVQSLAGKQTEAIQTLRSGMNKALRKRVSVILRLAELYVLTNKFSEAKSTLELAEQELREGFRTGKRGDDAAESIAVLQLLWSRWYWSYENPDRDQSIAAQHFAQAVEHSQQGKMSAQTLYELGKSAQQFGRVELAIATFAATFREVPQSMLVRVAFADAVRRAGRFADAAREYVAILNKAASQPGGINESEVYTSLARCLLAMQLKMSPENRNWSDFDQTMQKVRQTGTPGVVSFFLGLAAELARGTGDPSSVVVARLKAAPIAFRRDPEFWQLAFRMYLDLKLYDQAEACLTALTELHRDPTAELGTMLALARAGSGRRNPTLPNYLASGVSSDTAASANSAPDEGTLTLRPTMPEGPAVAGALDQLLAGIDAAYAKRDLATAQKLEGQIRASTAKNSSESAYAEILRLLLQASRGSAEALATAKRQSDDLRLRRPNWRPAHLASAAVAEAEGKTDDAIESYREAQHLGESRPELLRRLIGLLLLADRPEEAQAQLDRVADSAKMDPLLLPIAAALAPRVGQVDRGIALVEKALAARPEDAEASAVLARLLMSTKDAAKMPRAQAAIRGAIRLAPADPRYRIALLHYYVETAQAPDRSPGLFDAAYRARELLASHAPRTAPELREYVTACCQELELDFPAAERTWRQLREKNKLLPPSLFPATAGTLESKSSAADSAAATRLGYSIQTVLLLLGFEPTGGPRSGAPAAFREDARPDAVVALFTRTPEAKARAISLLAGLPAGPARIGDQLLLARIHRASGDTARAAHAYRELLRAGPSTPERVEILRFAFAHGWKDTANQLAALTKQDASNSALPEFRVRQLLFEKNSAGALASLKKDVLGDPRQPFAPRFEKFWSASLPLAGIADNELAALCREMTKDQPVGGILLADWLSTRPADLPEAMRSAVAACSAAPTADRLIRLAAICGRGPVPKECQAKLDALLARDKFANDRERAEFLAGTALVREQTGPLDDAIRRMREAVRLEPGRPERLAALARMLSQLIKANEEAIPLANRAIQSAGPTDALLDTKGNVLTNLNQSADSVPILEYLCMTGNSECAPLVHLAAAQARAGKMDVARGLVLLAESADRRDLGQADRAALHNILHGK